MDEINQSIPVWICNECTYCNVEQLAQCQMCLNSYAQNKQYVDLINNTQENYEYFSAAEQKLILESVECSKLKQNADKPPPSQNKRKKMKRKSFDINFLKQFQTKKTCQMMPGNIINEVPDILAPGLGLIQEEKKENNRKKFSLDKLLSFKDNKECQKMPENIINPISDILSPIFCHQRRKQTTTKRVKFSVNQLTKLQNNKECKLMPDNIINEVPDILAPGLGAKLMENIKPRRAKFSMDKLFKLREDKSCKLMPDNIINDIPEILAPGLGAKLQQNCQPPRAKFTMDQLLSVKNKKTVKTMPDNIINEVPDILAPGLGANLLLNNKPKRAKFSIDQLLGFEQKDDIINELPQIFASKAGSKTTSRRKFDITRLKEMRSLKSHQTMPDNIINAIPDILAPGLGMKMGKGSRKFSIEQLKDLRNNKECQKMPENVINDIPEILAPGLGKQTGKERRRRRFSLETLAGLRFEEGYDSMPSNIIEDTPEILAPGLGIESRNEEEEKMIVLEEDCGVNDDHLYQDDDDDSDDSGDGLLIIDEPQKMQQQAKGGSFGCRRNYIKKMSNPGCFGGLITMKLCLNTNINYSPNLNYDRHVEGITYHNLLECQLDIYDVAQSRYQYHAQIEHYQNGKWKGKKIASTSFIPSNDQETDLKTIISLPVQYKYKYHLTEGNKILDDDMRIRLNYEPLQGIAEQLLNIRYPELQQDTYIVYGGSRYDDNKWNVDISDHKYIDSPVINYKLFNVLMRFIPFKDIIKFILFPYLGYDEIDTIKLYLPITTYIPMKKCKLNDEHRQLMEDNDGRLPFKVKSSELNTVTEMEYGQEKYTEIGFIAKQRYHNYFGRGKRRNFWGKTEIYNKYTKSYYYRDKWPQYNNNNGHHDMDDDVKPKMSNKEKQKAIEIEISKDIRKYYPKQHFAHLKYNVNDNNKGLTATQRRNNRRGIKKRLENERIRTWKINKVNYPRWNNWKFKRLSHRYVQRKWSAYWKLLEI